MIITEHTWRGYKLEVEHRYDEDGKVTRHVKHNDMTPGMLLEFLREVFPEEK